MNQEILSLLERELIPSTGCTEPSALAYGAAVARNILGAEPESMTLRVSECIFKNAHCVHVPNTGGLRGLDVSLAAGALAGDPQAKLNAISHISAVDIARIRTYVEEDRIKIEILQSEHLIDFILTLHFREETAIVRFQDEHTNLVYAEKNGEVLIDRQALTESSLDVDLDSQKVWDFVHSFELEDLRELLDRQIDFNLAIAEEGIRGDYGAGIGQLFEDSSTIDKAVAYAAAASDARMSGCNLPVIINGGSGNQGITTSVPLIVYAQAKGYSREEIYRPLVLSNLLSLYQKQLIGRLSSFCGVVCAGAAVGAAIALLETGDESIVVHSFVNALGLLPGMICDGAKASCAGKIAMSVRAGFIGYQMAGRSKQFYRGEGIIASDIDATIRNVGRLAREGMAQTNRCILDMMTCC